MYGQHTQLQLLDFVQGSLGQRPIFGDSSHNHGFLHRLDVPSSGLILAAESYEAWYDLQVQLYAGGIRREYTALCRGWIPKSLREVRAQQREGVKQPTTSGGRGKPSITRLKVLERLWVKMALSKLSVEISTGRKHQIRSHFAHVGHPTVRDALYTSTSTFEADMPLCARNWLHRHKLHFQDACGTLHAVACPLPNDLIAQQKYHGFLDGGVLELLVSNILLKCPAAEVDCGGPFKRRI